MPHIDYHRAKRVLQAAALALCVFMLGGNVGVMADDSSSYRLDSGDKLRIKVHEWPDMTGEYKVSSDRSIALPVIGDLPVSGMVPKEIATAIAKQLKEKAKLTEEPVATVEVIQFRPFFILGHVMKPGEYEYRPRLNVLQAVSMAGGLFRFMDPGLQRLDRDSIQARGEVLAMTRRIDQLRAAEARIDAERKGAEAIDFPQDLVDQQDSPQIRQMLDEERGTLLANRQALAQETASTEGLRDLLEKEIDSLEKQAAAEAKQLETVMDEMEGVKTLAAKGLSTSPRTYLLERTKAQIVGQKQSIETNIIRSRQSISQSEQRLNQFRNERTAKLNAEKIKTQGDINEAREKMQMMQKLVLEAEVSAPAQIQQRYKEDKVKYSIVRSSQVGAQELPASEATLLEPNDVLKVERSESAADLRASSQSVVAP